MSPILTLSPSIPVPLTPSLGGTGVANANANTLTLSSAGTLNLNSGTVTGTSGKTLTFSNSITLAGTDSTTMTFPSTSATIARTDTGQTFTGQQVFNDTVNTTGLSFSFTSSSLTTGALFRITSSSTSSSASQRLFEIIYGTGFAGSAIEVTNAAESATVFLVNANGNITTQATSIALDVSGGTAANIFKSNANMESAVSTGTVTLKNVTSSSINNAGWIIFTDHAGTTRRIPYI